jgi:hypothetical protein
MLDTFILLCGLTVFGWVLYAIGTHRPEMVMAGGTTWGPIASSVIMYIMALQGLVSAMRNVHVGSEAQVLVGTVAFGSLFASATIVLGIIASEAGRKAQGKANVDEGSVPPRQDRSNDDRDDATRRSLP